jgi:hypothetical protein
VAVAAGGAAGGAAAGLAPLLVAACARRVSSSAARASAQKASLSSASSIRGTDAGLDLGGEDDYRGCMGTAPQPGACWLGGLGQARSTPPSVPVT